MKTSFVILLGCVLLSSACTEKLKADINNNKTKTYGTETIPIDDALSSLDAFLSLTNIKTKSEIDPIGEDDVFVIGGQELEYVTRSGEGSYIPDTLLYAVNFADGGFAVMAANNELNSPLLCVTDLGNPKFRRKQNFFA